jgi:hypothetical protein
VLRRRVEREVAAIARGDIEIFAAQNFFKTQQNVRVVLDD